MEGLRSELYRLGLKNGYANRMMSLPQPEKEIITDPVKVEQLKVIAQAYTSGAITAQQAAMLVSRV